MPFNRSDLIIRKKKPASDTPERSPLNIKATPKRAKPEPPKPARMEVGSDMRKRMDELKRRVVEKNPDLAHPPGTVPERKPLNIKAKPKGPLPPGRTPLNINIKPKSAFEWVQAA
jgi:hypothetical protein